MSEKIQRGYFMPDKKAREKKREIPHVFAILLILMVVALIATWLIPSGSYERVPLEGTSRMIVDPESFHYTEKEWLTPWKFMTLILDGLTGAAMVAFAVIIIGGAWEVINATGAIAGAVKSLSRKFKKRDYMLFPVLMFVFALIAAIVGGAELMIVYLPAILPIVLMLGYDTMTAMACVMVSAVTAFAVSVTNPFTVAIGQQITGIELYSGSWYRIILQVVFFFVGVWYVLRYAKKVKANPEASLVYRESREYAVQLEAEREEEQVCAPGRQMMIGLTLAAILAVMVFGIIKWGWYMNEIIAMFLLAAVLSAAIGGIGVNKACSAFAKGASSVVSAALVCGLSNCIAVILTQGGIIDVVIHSLASVIVFLPKSVSLVGVFIVQELFNFLVNSGSGQFLITMPILAPLGDVVGLESNALILASQMGDGLTNVMFPTSGVLMAVLACAKVPYQKWLKFILPYVGIMTVLGSVALIIAQLIGYA